MFTSLRLHCRLLVALVVAIGALSCSSPTEESRAAAVRALFADQHAEGDLDFERYAARVEAALAAHHRGPLDMSEFQKYPHGPPRDVYLRWENKALEELWAWDESLELMERWIASEAALHLAGEELPVGRLARVHRALDELTERYPPYLRVAETFFGPEFHYFTEQRDEAMERLAALNQGFAAILAELGHDVPAARYIARGEAFLVRERQRTLSVPAVGEHFHPWLEEGQRAAADARLAERRETLPRRLGDQLIAEAMGRPRIRFIGTDSALAALIEERNLGPDPALQSFLEEALERFYAEDLDAALEHVDAATFPRDLLEAHQAEWEGWTLESIGPYVEVRTLRDGTLEAALHDVELRNERGDLWIRDRGLILEEREGGGYAVVYPGSRQQQREAGQDTQQIYNRRLSDYEFERSVAEALARESAATQDDSDD